MRINKRTEGGKLTMSLEGRLDTGTAPELSEALNESLDGVTELVLDLTLLEYISSSGLRVLLTAQKQVGGNMVVKNPSELVMEVFQITGLADFLTIV